MIDLPYFFFLGCILFLLAFATNRDRNALRIILIASIVSEVLVVFVTRQIHAPWKLVVPGAVETLTILALLSYGRTRTAFFQAVLLIVAWWSHIQCYLDLIWNTNVVYDHYEKILSVVAVLQLLACYDTIFSIGRSVQGWGDAWAARLRGVHSGSSRAALLRGEDSPRI